MAVTAASLKAAWPEFSTATDVLVEAKIAQAERRIDEATFGATYDDAVTMLACHLLALTPTGRAMRLDPEGRAGHYGLGVTFYGQEFEQLRIDAVCGIARTAGEGEEWETY